ncbi:response regulator transcription factor [uncultured Actinomyces sp.]|uniref:response regulator transcription factor n=1 Tax=uncultured Actinomyces sp. TaxID=249061 RepID=UPI0028896E5C|nr:response regulator transcription factor [uncultured Actinomyces sp.]
MSRMCTGGGGTRAQAGAAGGTGGGVDVLLVEDEAELARSTREYLEAFGVRAEHRATAEEALAALPALAPAVVLLDVGLPGMSGFALCARLREAAPGASVIFVSARTSEADQVLGLDLGADDYLTKPYSLQVLLAKVRRALARAGRAGSAASSAPGGPGALGGPGGPGGPVAPGGRGGVPGGRGAPGRAGAPTRVPDVDDGRLRIDLDAGRTWVAGREVHLTAIEHRILAHLVRNRGRVCSKRDIIDAVWGEPYTSEGTLTVHMRRLRRRIEADPDAPVHLRTVWGRGYLFAEADEAGAGSGGSGAGGPGGAP